MTEKTIPSVIFQASKIRLSEAFVRACYRELEFLDKQLHQGQISQENHDESVVAINNDLNHLLGQIEELKAVSPQTGNGAGA